MFAKKYIVEAIGTTILTLIILLINNPIATSFIWASLLIIRKNQTHGYFNLAVTCSLYAARFISLKDMLRFSFYQTIGSFAGLICFKYITGSYFTPDTTIINSFSVLSIIEALSAAILCMTILTIHEPTKEKNSSSVAHTAIISAITLIGLQTVGTILHPSFGLAVFLGTFLDTGNELFKQQLHINTHYTLVYFVIPTAAGLCSYQIKKWTNEEL
ncbi:hypothetical protein EKK58_03615 [Candidatus Dependentiae bacterium]|nr:MAG: hypothetical protein EKK58_03615 [Candidatus Dependentiae bacterium]